MIPKPIAYLAQESDELGQIQRAKNAGFKSVALQLGVATKESIKAFRDAGLFVALWGPVTERTVVPEGAQAFIPQVESDAEYEGCVRALRAGIAPGLLKGVVSHYWGLYNRLADGSASRDGTRIALLRGLGVTEYHVETYGEQDGHWNVIEHLGWGQFVVGMRPEEQTPLLGTWMGERPLQYIGLETYKENFGIYIIEQTADTQLTLYRSLIPDEPVIPNPDDVRARITAEAHTWLDPHEGDDKLSRLRSIARIAQTTDAQWTNVRARIIQALDSVGAGQG